MPRLPVLRFVVLAGAVAAAVVPAAAQDRPFSVSVLGGVTFPVSDARHAMGVGWNLGVAGEVRVSSALRLRADYLYDRYALVDKPIDVGLGPMLPAFREAVVNAKSQMHFVSVDLAWSRENLEGRKSS